MRVLASTPAGKFSDDTVDPRGAWWKPSFAHWAGMSTSPRVKSRKPLVDGELTCDVCVFGTDADAVQFTLQSEALSQIMNCAELAEAMPGLVAKRSYVPWTLIVRLEKNACPPDATCVTVPPSTAPAPGSGDAGSMATLITAFDEVTRLLLPSSTSTSIGSPAGVLKAVVVIAVLTTVWAGWPVAANPR